MPIGPSGSALDGVRPRGAGRVYHSHGGGIHGFGTQTMFHAPYQTGAIVLTNLWPNAVSASLAETLLDAVIDDWDEMPPITAPRAPRGTVNRRVVAIARIRRCLLH